MMKIHLRMILFEVFLLILMIFEGFKYIFINLKLETGLSQHFPKYCNFILVLSF